MTRLRVVGPLVAAAALAAVAFATAAQAGCSDPGYYAALPGGGYELVGGCVAAGDLLVPEPVAPVPAPAEGDVDKS